MSICWKLSVVPCCIRILFNSAFFHVFTMTSKMTNTTSHDATMEEVEVISRISATTDPDVEKAKSGGLDLMLVDTERAPEARGHLASQFDRSYWFSPAYIGSYIAVVLAANAGIGGFSLAAPDLSIINNDIGPSPNITWVSLVWIICQGIGALIVG